MEHSPQSGRDGGIERVTLQNAIRAWELWIFANQLSANHKHAYESGAILFITTKGVCGSGG